MTISPTSCSSKSYFDREEAPTPKVTAAPGFTAQEVWVKYRALSARIKSIMTLIFGSFTRPEKLSDVLRAERSALNLKHLHPQQK